MNYGYAFARFKPASIKRRAGITWLELLCIPLVPCGALRPLFHAR
jgi:hypothetical protein